MAAARLELLKAEKELTRRSDELSGGGRSCRGFGSTRSIDLRPTRAAPRWRTSSEGGRLLVYHFMFGYGARLTDERRGCTGCSLVADHFDGVVPHLNGRDITLLCVNRPVAGAPGLQAANGLAISCGFRRSGSDFNYDFGVAFTEEQRKNGADYNFRMSTSLSRRRRV